MRRAPDEQRRQIGGAHAGEAAEQPEVSSPAAGCRGGEILDEAIPARAAPDHDAGETRTRIVSPPRRAGADQVDDCGGGDGEQPPAKASASFETPSEKKMRAPRERRAGGGAQYVRRDERLRNRPWKAAPATASALPTSTAATMRAPNLRRHRLERRRQPGRRPDNLARIDRPSSSSETGKRPSAKATAIPTARTMAATASSGAEPRRISRAPQHLFELLGGESTW